ncbi:MAG: glycosyltransferase family 39 protein [Lacunisphaera sp.]
MKPLSLDRLAPVAVAFILILHAAVAVWAAAKESVTADEILHVTGGYYIDRFGDYRIQPENGVLPQRLHGLAALWTGAPAPVLKDNEYWRTSSNLVNCHQFFYETGHDHFPMLMLARALNTLFSIGAGLLVFLWGRHLAGPLAGLVAATLYASDPNILAHAALATSDLAAVFFLLASASAFWWQLATPSPGRVAVSVITFGLACVAKFSAVLLLPVFIGLLAWRIAGDSAGRRRWWRLGPALGFSHVAGAVAVIWLFHGFRYSGFSPELPAADHYLVPWAEVLPFVGWQGRIIEWCREARLLPESFLWGYAFVIQASHARAAFLAGETGLFGWTSFFPLAFAWKTTLGVLAGLVLALIALARRWNARRAAIATDLGLVAPLVLLFAVYWAISLTSHLNIGHRHLLPTYPVLFIWLGCWAASLAASGWRGRGTIAALLAAHVAASVSVAPHFLAFFNRLAGGPANGYRLLVDSSLDWGQDLPGLRDWLQSPNTGASRVPVFLSYFGTGEPAYYHVEAEHLPFINGFKFPRRWYEPRPGLYCISATMLQQVYSGFGGSWTPAMEEKYRELRALEPSFRDFLTKPETRPTLRQFGDDKKWTAGWVRYDDLRFARLCAHLRTREPDAMIGYSILIYRVDAAELATALGPAASPH